MHDHFSCEVVTIGTELLLGQIEDTNTSYIARQMGDIGITVRYRTAVGDRLDEIVHVLKNAVSRCDLVITTGGLGPTLDDLTREAVAQVAGVALEFKSDLMEQIKSIFKKAGYKMPENNRRQAYVPEGSRVIENPVGTAPAFMVKADGKPVISLPGVPRELKHLMATEVIPLLKESLHLGESRLLYRVLKVVGMGESKVDHLIGDLIKPGDNPEIGLLASIGEITIRIAAVAEDKAHAYALISPLEEEIRGRLGKAVFGSDGDTLEKVIEDMLNASGRHLSIADTFSGGLAAERMHKLPSTSLLSSIVIPSREYAESFAGMSSGGSEEDGAVAMSRAVCRQSGSDVGLSVFGFPAPSALGFRVRAAAAVKGVGIDNIFSWEMGGDMATIQQRAALIGLNTLRLALLECGTGTTLSA
ncbi:MAG: competence/damage-inducible protein A [Deltaproteobacteria bacterium CG_4_8_14_3_um_filter_51_11]|nr:CinA family nicotinamide mononucleotide deamidase-related protein [bacterium]OIP42714.1 MAG: hypothetical protein AUK25_03315 [Desulfobacteraceae bacterium CG2_30_51_40]PIP47366.1 MAG: competence/damage-inducible protein A [Deltaproteobacteria bacterium CG23_combo_of_CG06-09_8_20_14_all_51_20]PIW01567.1 MAG: competence/damage-inducible protein A [Deltaproteobacteria bacterium CG17_big_fil_post_rev_8_21_14_2_50_51_6]PIX19158.1 MAG: competence/damage-inducible protein A [Deltaproteobacteria ba